MTAGYGAAVEITAGADVEVRNTKISGAQYGVVVDDADGVLDHCEIRDITDDGVIMRLGARVVLRHSTVSGCGFRGVYMYQAVGSTIERSEVTRTGEAGIAVAEQSAPTIREC